MQKSLPDLNQTPRTRFLQLPSHSWHWLGSCFLSRVLISPMFSWSALRCASVRWPFEPHWVPVMVVWFSNISRKVSCWRFSVAVQVCFWAHGRREFSAHFVLAPSSPSNLIFIRTPPFICFL